MTKNDELKNRFTAMAQKVSEFFKNLIAQSVDGTELDFGSDVQTLEQVVVGVPCSQNGKWVLADGRTIVVEGNVITEVTEAEETPDPAIEQMKKDNEELTAKLTEANAKIDELTNKAVQFETLKTEFNDFKNQFSNHSPEAVNVPSVPTPQEKEKRFKYSKK